MNRFRTLAITKRHSGKRPSRIASESCQNSEWRVCKSRGRILRGIHGNVSFTIKAFTKRSPWHRLTLRTYVIREVTMQWKFGLWPYLHPLCDVRQISTVSYSGLEKRVLFSSASLRCLWKWMCLWFWRENIQNKCCTLAVTAHLEELLQQSRKLFCTFHCQFPSFGWQYAAIKVTSHDCSN